MSNFDQVHNAPEVREMPQEDMSIGEINLQEDYLNSDISYMQELKSQDSGESDESVLPSVELVDAEISIQGRGKGPQDNAPGKGHDRGRDKNQEKDWRKEEKELRELYATEFYGLDTNNDGFVSDWELATARDTVDPRVLAVLKEYKDDIEELHNDEWGDENNGISIRDIDALFDARTKWIGEGELISDAIKYAEKNFDELDLNNDGRISKWDLFVAGNRDDLTPQEKQNIETLKRHCEEMEVNRNDDWGFEVGISRDDLRYTAPMYADDAAMHVAINTRNLHEYVERRMKEDRKNKRR